MTKPEFVDDAKPKRSAYELLLEMTPERRASAILELKRRRDGGLVLRKPKPIPKA